jgi:hypothetical protein
MELWNSWLSLVNHFESACSRKRTFFWLSTILIGFTIKFDSIGVTSIARGAGLLPGYYTCLLHFFNSTAVNLEVLQSNWINLVLNKFDGLVKINGRYLIIGDGIKYGKEGKKMPGVKWLHQESESNSKAEFIMGHSIQAVSILGMGLSTYFAIALLGKIHEGIRLTYKDSRMLLDKMFEMLTELKLPVTVYFVADKYYCSGRFMKSLIASGIHLITMTTDLTLDLMDIIYGYSLCFKIEIMFKQAVHQIGVFMYRFWLKMMLPRKRGSGDSVLQFESAEFKNKVLNKLNAYHLFIQLGFIAHGLMQYLSIHCHKTVWKNFGTWLRTIRENTLPSEKVVAMALSKTYIKFLIDGIICTIFKKFLEKRIDISQLQQSNFVQQAAA